MLTVRRIDFDQVNFYESLMYLQCLHYRTTNQLQKKFHDGSSVREAKQFFKNLIYAGKKRFAVRTNGQKKPSLTQKPSAITCKIAENLVTPLPLCT